MVIIRLSRGGRKNFPHYKIVVADQRSKLNGRFIENVGFYIPRKNSRKEEYKLDINRIIYWLSKGAKLSERVKSLLKKPEYNKEFENFIIKNKSKNKKRINKYRKDEINEIFSKPLEKEKINKVTEDNKSHKARIVEFKERIKKVDSLSEIVVAEVKTVENHGEWGITTTSSLVPIDGSSMTEWNNNIVFKKLNRYLLVNRNTGKLAWSRIAKTRITYFCNSIHWTDNILIDKNHWDITYNALWGVKDNSSENLSIKLSNPFFNDGSYLIIKAWFGLSELNLLDIQIVSSNSFGRNKYNDLYVYIADKKEEFIGIILNHISQPFKYSSKLVGVQAKDFFGVSYGRFRVRAGLLNKYPILSVEKII